MAEQNPRVLNERYEIHRRLARGGMAQVYLSRDRSLDRPVAVKVLIDLNRLDSPVGGSHTPA